MKKQLAIILALLVLSLVIAGCALPPAEDVTVEDINAEVNAITSDLNSDLSELDALDQELADLENLDLG